MYLNICGCLLGLLWVLMVVKIINIYFLVMSYVNIGVDIGMCVSLILPGLNGIVQLIT